MYLKLEGEGEDHPVSLLHASQRSPVLALRRSLEDFYHARTQYLDKRTIVLGILQHSSGTL